MKRIVLLLLFSGLMLNFTACSSGDLRNFLQSQSLQENIEYAKNKSEKIMGQETHGGDPLQGRVIEIKEYIKDNLKKDLIDYILFLKMNPNSIRDDKMRDIFLKLISAGIEEDVGGSHYNILLEQACTDSDGKQVAGSSRLNEIGGDICFSAYRLSEQNASHAEMVALAFHEHSHHYGIKDEAHTLFKYVRDEYPDTLNHIRYANTCKISNEARCVVLDPQIQGPITLKIKASEGTVYDAGALIKYKMNSYNIYGLDRKVIEGNGLMDEKVREREILISENADVAKARWVWMSMLFIPYINIPTKIDFTAEIFQNGQRVEGSKWTFTHVLGGLHEELLNFKFMPPKEY